MGPKPILSGYFGANSGLVSALAVDPTNASTIYAGTIGGGVWKTTDGGGIWSPMTDQQPSLVIGSLAIDPGNHNVIYAGTGAIWDGGRQAGAGVLKSIDAGAHWSVVGNGAGTFDGVSVHQLQIDPGTTSTIYASTSAGIYKSIDGGANWSSIMSFGTLSVADMGIDASAPSTIYVATTGGAPGEIFKSTNGGTSFSTLTNGLPTSGIGRVSLGISHSNPQRLYATMALAGTNCSAGVWRTDNGGASWTHLATPDFFAESGGFACQGEYDNYTAVDPTNPDVAYVGAIDLWKTNSAGAQFTNMTIWQNPFGPRIHPDHHALAFASNLSGTTFVLGNDGGAWLTTTAGASFTNLNNTLETALFYYGVAVPGVALGGLQDNGVVKYVGTPGWIEVMGGDGSTVAIDPTNPNILYASIYGPLDMYKSGDGGRHFAPIQSGINPADICLCPDEAAIMDPSHPNVLVAGAFYSKVYRTVNGGGSWGMITPGPLLPSSYGETHGLAVAPTDTTEIWGAFGWSVFVHIPAGSWLDRSVGLPQFGLWRGIAVDPGDPQHVFVSEAGNSLGGATVIGAVYETSDLGAHWQDVTGALPNVPVNALVIDGYGRLIAGTDQGVYARDCGTWSQAGTGLPKARVTDVRLSPDRSVLFASTYGRGMWTLPLPATPPCSPPTQVLAQAGNGSATLTWKGPSSLVTGYNVTPFVGGVAGTPVLFNSPATVEVLGGLTNGTTYTFTVAAVNSAGPGPPSPATSPVTPSTTYPWSVVSTRQYSLANSDGSTWTDIDSTKLQLTIQPTADSVAIVSGNADLWTSTSGFNQDIGIGVSGGGTYPTTPGQPEAWKESGGLAGTFSPNAAFVQAVLHLKATSTYIVKLRWKTNRSAAAATIWAGAGPIGPNFSPARLTAVLMPESPQAVFNAQSQQQYALHGSDGVTWQPLDVAALTLSFKPTVASHAIVSANADLWTSVSGYNQDIGIAIAGAGYPSVPNQPEAWKESGGLAGTFSPNAAFVQAVIPLAANMAYSARLVWKANRGSPGSAAIWAGAGPINGLYSGTRLTVEIVPDSTGTLLGKTSRLQYPLANCDGATWSDMDATNLVVSLTPSATCLAILSANADLWTAYAGFNQDIGVDVVGGGGLAPDKEGWKESGGSAGTFSPNAAFAQTTFELNAATAYQVRMQWKTNRPAAGATIFAGAGPIGTLYSPATLTVQLFC